MFGLKTKTQRTTFVFAMHAAYDERVRRALIYGRANEDL